MNVALPNHIFILYPSDYDPHRSNYLLFNTTNQVLIEVDKKEFNILNKYCNNNLKLSNQNTKIIQTILRSNILDNNYTSKNNKCSRIVIVPTLLCNKNCNYCYHGGSKKLSINHKDIPLLLSFIKNFLQKRNIEKLIVIWHGGEPLIRYDILKTISVHLQHYCNEKGIEYEESLLTNGLLLGNINIFNILNNTAINEIQISIDQKTTELELYQILKSIEKILNKKPISIFIKYNLSEKSFENIKNYIDYFSVVASKGNLTFRFGYIESHGDILTPSPFPYIHFVRETWKLHNYLRQMRLGWDPELPEMLHSACVANDSNAITIGPDLYAYRCNVNIPHKTWRLFNIKKPNFILNKSAEDYFMSYQPLDDPNCSNCRIVYSCLGGCHVKRIYGQRTREYCEGTQERIKLQILDYYFSR